MMRIDAAQHLRMEQRMKLSPRMIQSMEILQLAALALEERIEQELEANPVLELREPEAGQQAIAEARQAAEDAKAEAQPMVVGETPQDSVADYQRLADFSEQYGESWDANVSESSEYHTPARRDDGERDSKMDAMANTMARSASLGEQLLDQWRFVELAPELRRAGEHVVEFIDDDGYFRVEMEQVLKQAPPGITQQHIDEALSLMQQRLEPPGIAARSLQECLQLQILALVDEEGEEEDLTAAKVLVDDYLKDIEMNRLPRISRASGLTLDQINAGLMRLRRLDPRPGRRLAPERPQAIMPDVIVEYDPVHDRYIAALNRGRQPMLRINPHYRDLAADKGQEKSTRQYLSQNMNNARWLIDALRQRNNTLLRVVNVVIDAQRDFLDHGPQHLKPLPMILVADQLGIHVGTVSRAVADKYMQTPRGIYPLRMFFSGGTESASGEEMSWAAVQAKLKEIIDREDPANPWSDDQLVEELKTQGIEIARRTVAKYRQQMNIPPARRRKKF